MKKFLLAVFIVALNFPRVLAQPNACDVRSITVQLRSVTNINGVCNAVFDLSWEQRTNNGNEMAYVHIWDKAGYPDLLANNLAYTPPPNHPDAVDLKAAIATIVIEENGSTTPLLGSSYMHDAAVPVLNTPDMEVHKIPVDADWDRMVVTMVPITLSNCNGTDLVADVWGCNAANLHNVHCFATNKPFLVGNPVITGVLNCTVPRTYSMSIRNEGTETILSTYRVYIDNGDMLYQPSSETLVFTSDQKSIPAEDAFTLMNASYLYNDTKPYSDRGLWIEVSTEGFSNKAIYFLNNLCAPLPVQYSSFNAAREGKIVRLLWTTASEINNAGFTLQRRIGGGEWENITSIPSKAPGGNSNTTLMYSHADPNPTHALSVYRILQTDIDQRFSYSDERMVSGEGMGIHIFPNPAQDHFYVVMENPQQAHDVSLFDMNGRLVGQWRNITTHHLEIQSPKPGTYIVQVVNLLTRQSVTGKLVVGGR